MIFTEPVTLPGGLTLLPVGRLALSISRTTKNVQYWHSARLLPTPVFRFVRNGNWLYTANQVYLTERLSAALEDKKRSGRLALLDTVDWVASHWMEDCRDYKEALDKGGDDIGITYLTDGACRKGRPHKH